ncbi:MAG: CcmD family protein [Flavobacteriales bacterium]|nr:CcmD family protein [Flavobacteriales bacterium]
MIKKILSLILALISPFVLFAQSMGGDVEMADGLRASGKIYIVVIVLCLIFLGLAIYMWRLDKKISKLEKQSS